MLKAWPPIFWWLASQRPPTWALCLPGPEVQLPLWPFLIPKDCITSWSASLPTFLLMLFLYDLVVREITNNSTTVSFLILTSGSTSDYHCQARWLDLWSLVLTHTCDKISAGVMAHCHCSTPHLVLCGVKSHYMTRFLTTWLVIPLSGEKSHQMAENCPDW